VKIQRGVTSDQCWIQRKRYTDFVNLDSELRISNITLNLPPKKTFGNFNREFIAERQVALQVNILAIYCPE